MIMKGSDLQPECHLLDVPGVRLCGDLLRSESSALYTQCPYLIVPRFRGVHNHAKPRQPALPDEILPLEAAAYGQSMCVDYGPISSLILESLNLVTNPLAS